MFKENDGHKQRVLFGIDCYLPAKLERDIEGSWASTFYREIFSRIDESKFSVLYSEKESRPNKPVNVLLGLDIIKQFFGYTDEQIVRIFIKRRVRVQLFHPRGLNGLNHS